MGMSRLQFRDGIRVNSGIGYMTPEAAPPPCISNAALPSIPHSGRTRIASKVTPRVLPSCPQPPVDKSTEKGNH